MSIKGRLRRFDAKMTSVDMLLTLFLEDKREKWLRRRKTR